MLFYHLFSSDVLNSHHQLSNILWKERESRYWHNSTQLQVTSDDATADECVLIITRRWLVNTKMCVHIRFERWVHSRLHRLTLHVQKKKRKREKNFLTLHLGVVSREKSFKSTKLTSTDETRKDEGIYVTRETSYWYGYQ